MKISSIDIEDLIEVSDFNELKTFFVKNTELTNKVLLNLEEVLSGAEKELVETKEFKRVKQINLFLEKFKEIENEFNSNIKIEADFYIEVNEFFKKQLEELNEDFKVPSFDYLNKLNSYLYLISNGKRVSFNPKEYQFSFEEGGGEEIFEKMQKLNVFLDKKSKETRVEIIKQKGKNPDGFTENEKKIMLEISNDNFEEYYKLVSNLKLDFGKDYIIFNRGIFRETKITRGNGVHLFELRNISDFLGEEKVKLLFKEELEIGKRNKEEKIKKDKQEAKKLGITYDEFEKKEWDKVMEGFKNNS